MESKICPKCKKDKLLTEFHNKKSENRLNSWCKECVYACQKARWKDRKRKAIELLGGGCCQCGYKKNISALQFHHINSDKKEFDWTRLRLRPWLCVVAELKKCVLLCANCHIEKHNPTNENNHFGSTGNDNPSLNRTILSTGICPVCKTDVYGTKHCSTKCAHLASRRVKNRPDKDEILEKLKTMSMLTVAKGYGVSDNAVRKWIK
jgi:hypothetical protein